MIVSQEASAALPLSPLGRGREAMTYGCEARPPHRRGLGSAAVSHLAELVRGDYDGEEGPLIRAFGPPSPQGEKGRLRLPGGKPPGAGVGFGAGASRAAWKNGKGHP